MRKILIFTAATLLLSACGGDDHDISYAEAEKDWGKGGVIYSYPYHGQANVSLQTPVVLRFAEALEDDFPAEDVALECQLEGCNDVPWRSFELVDDAQGVVLTPEVALQPNTEYCVVSGTVKLPNETLCFHTTLAQEKRGSLADMGANQALKLAASFPNLTAASEPIVDFSNFRLRFNQPLQRNAIHYGEHIVLRNAAGDVVAASLLVDKHLLTLSPKQRLTPDEEYSLELAEVPALYGGELSETFTFTPESTEPRSILVQDTVSASDADAPCVPAANPKISKLTGAPLNCVPLQSVLLGSEDATMQQGDILAELAFLPKFAKVSPLRIPRGSLLTGTNIDVKIAGAVPAAVDGSMSTGDVSVSFISDAVGYIFPNPYSSAADAPRQVRLFMDVAMTAENATPNAALSQDLLHVELNGMATLDGKNLEIDALGIVEPEVLGTEVAFGLLSFQMKSYSADEQAQRLDKVTTEPIKPELQSIYPLVESGAEAEAMQASDAITFNFSAPIDPDSVELGHSVEITENGQPVEDASVRVEGASIIVKLNQGLRSESEYHVALTSDIKGLPIPVVKRDGGVEEGYRYYFAEATDPLAQGAAIDALSHDFTTPVFHEEGLEYAGHVEASEAPIIFTHPVILTAYPGYPCAMTWHNEGGTCVGDEGENNPALVLPRQKVPANRALRLTFSKPMQRLPEGAFYVEDEEGNEVKGSISQQAMGLVFTPNEPWQAGEKYTYSLYTGDCANGPCSVTEQRLITAPLKGTASDAFADFVVEFEGAEATTNVFLPLRNTPTADTAAALTYYPALNQKAEARLAAGEGIPNSTKLDVTGWDGVLTNARVGCAEGDCPAFSYIHLVGNLDTEIFGAGEYQCLFVKDDGAPDDNYCPEVEPGEQALAVGIYPTAIMAGSADVFAEATALIKLPAPTGAQVMRMHPGGAFPEQAEGHALAQNALYRDNPNGLIPGWIRQSEEGPVFETKVQLYLDGPNLEVPLNGKHNLQNYPLTLNLRGAVEFSEDGRMRIHQANLNPEHVDVKLRELLGLLSSGIYLGIPERGAYLTYESQPVK